MLPVYLWSPRGILLLAAGILYRAGNLKSRIPAWRSSSCRTAIALAKPIERDNGVKVVLKDSELRAYTRGPKDLLWMYASDHLLDPPCTPP